MGLLPKLAGIAVAAAAITCLVYPRAVNLVLTGTRRLRQRRGTRSRAAHRRPGLLVIALDGVGRTAPFELLRGGELPELAALLGGGDRLEHAHLSTDVISVLPSTTVAAWASIFSGAPVGWHGVTGNEFFVRTRAELAAPAPVSVDDVEPMLAVYRASHADRYLEVPTVYERLREQDPHLRVWVAMSQFHRGADRLLVPDADALAAAFGAFLGLGVPGTDPHPLFATLDAQTVDTVVDALETGPVPDVLTVYLPGADLHAHRAKDGPDPALRAHLREAVDPALGRLRRALAARGALDDRWVVLVSDHGHTDVLEDADHALGIDLERDPPAVLARAGFRVRRFAWQVPPEEGFDAVFAYQGAIAYVYLADRSTFLPSGARDWSRPPRLEEDVLAAAEAFHLQNERGEPVPRLRGTLDLVLARRPRPPGSEQEPFQVYRGGGRLEPLEEYLRREPRPSYVAFAPRLRALATGPHGDRAGDVLLLAHNGDRDRPEDRFYFSRQYRSWHGSPSPQDSEIALAVAHPAWSRERIAALVREALGDDPVQHRIGDLLVRLRDG